MLATLEAALDAAHEHLVAVEFATTREARLAELMAVVNAVSAALDVALAEGGDRA